MYRSMTAAACTFVFAATTGPLAAATYEFNGTFLTQNQNMWGPNAGVNINEDFYALQTDVLPERTIGEIKQVTNPRRTVYDETLTSCNALKLVTGGTLDCTEVRVPGIGPVPPAPTPPTEPPFPRPPLISNPFDAENVAWQKFDAAMVVYRSEQVAHAADVKTWQADVFACTTVYGLTGPQCVDGFEPLGAPPPATVADGAQLTISDAELDFGLRARLSLAGGEVDAKQDFTVKLDVPEGEFDAGDEVTIEITGSLGDAALSSEFDVIDTGVDVLTKLTAKANLKGAVLGDVEDVDLLDISVQNPDGSAVATEILGLEIGQGDISGNLFGIAGTVDLSEGIGKQVRTPLTPGGSLGVSVGDITAYVPDLDLAEITGPGPLVSDITPTNRTGSGETPTDFLKTDIDLDVVTTLYGAPLGVGGGIPLLLDVQMDLGDADIGAFFGITQKQTLTNGSVEVVLNFSMPTEVETTPGSGIFERVSQKVVTLGQDLKIRHPGDNLKVTPEYRLTNTQYANLTEAIISSVFSVQLLNFGLTGIVPEALGIGGFTVFEKTFDLGAPKTLGTLFDQQFDLEGFNTLSGEAFTLAARATGPAPVPLPAGAWFLLAGLGAFGMMSRRRTTASL